jgi:hypothetical protein
MRRRKPIAALGGLPIAACVCVLWLQCNRPETSISSATYHRIAIGMTLSEVTAILGPPGDRSTMDTEYYYSTPGDVEEGFWRENPRVDRTLTWLTDTSSVTVGFDGAGVVQTGPSFRLGCQEKAFGVGSESVPRTSGTSGSRRRYV